jgi:hypothetical protein
MEITRPQDKVAEGKLLDLGSLGQIEEVPEAADWPEIPKFPWFGVQIRVHPSISDTALIDMIEIHGELDPSKPEDSVRAAIAVKDFVRSVIHPADFEDFWKLGKANGYSTEKFAETCGMIIEQVTGDPTQESDDSSRGDSSTVTKLTGVSSSEAIQAELEQEGRPDLAEFFLLARENGVAPSS